MLKGKTDEHRKIWFRESTCSIYYSVNAVQRHSKKVLDSPHRMRVIQWLPKSLLNWRQSLLSSNGETIGQSFFDTNMLLNLLDSTYFFTNSMGNSDYIACTSCLTFFSPVSHFYWTEFCQVKNAKSSIHPKFNSVGGRTFLCPLPVFCLLFVRRTI